MGRMSNHPTRDAVAALLNQGLTNTEISRRIGVSRSTVRRWIEKISAEQTVVHKTDDEILGFIEQLAPINVQMPGTYVNVNLNNDVAMVIGDTHFGSHCQKTIDIFYSVLDDVKPGKVILNGDTLDMLAVSRYPKDPRESFTLVDERVAYHQFLHGIRSILGDKVEIIETNANHSGNGVEGRWWRYLSERLGAAAAIPEVIDALSYEKIFIPRSVGVKLVDQYQLGMLTVLHGDVVRKAAGMSVRGMMEKWRTSIMMNHTHRLGMTAERVPGIGMRREQQLIGYENGCACKLNPSYATAANWQNGFSIVMLDAYGDFSVEQVTVVDGKAVVLTTGKTYTVSRL